MQESVEAIELSGQQLKFLRKSRTKVALKEATLNEDLNIASVKHHWAVKLLHWGTVMALLVGIACMFIRDYIDEYKYQTLLLELHRQMGVLVLLGVGIRLTLKFWIGKPKGMKPLPVIFHLCGAVCHSVLYSLLVVLPFLGLGLTNAHNVKVNFLGLGKLPSLVAADSDLANTLTDYHLLGSWILLGVLVLHISSALMHHCMFKDEVLSAMLPGKSKVSFANGDKIIP
jgi:cytochrome b561